MNTLLKIVLTILVMSTIWFHGNYHGKNTERLAWEGEVSKAVEQARETERKQQEAVNHVIQQQSDDLAAINARLNRDIISLRNRKERVREIHYPGTDCTIQYREGLSIGRAEAFAGLGADCNRERAAKIACYKYADAIQID